MAHMMTRMARMARMLTRWLAVCQDPQEVGALVTTRCTVSTVRDH